ncbi:fimbrial protein [Obesumbacterium proteus]|uniref:fimbrial protein n=1 Tax=Obesumbacterium proteus TaxID=82983 RepID=UPI00069ACF37|nr:fimbrial protein [Obesumbacterium proteus]TBL53663.1 type 1 fimbrial protein [Obesumbacterium proteus]
MKFWSKIVLRNFVLCAIAVIPFSVFANSFVEHGRVNMNGSIVASACALAVDSIDQHIDLGSLPIGIIARDGQGPEKPFHLSLEGCEIFRPGSWSFNSVRVTFDGLHDDVPHLIKVIGSAQGVGLLIKDSEGNHVFPGKALTSLPLEEGAMTLNYTLSLEKNNEKLLPGRYRAGIRFKVEYE